MTLMNVESTPRVAFRDGLAPAAFAMLGVYPTPVFGLPANGQS